MLLNDSIWFNFALFKLQLTNHTIVESSFLFESDHKWLNRGNVEKKTDFRVFTTFFFVFLLRKLLDIVNQNANAGKNGRAKLSDRFDAFIDECRDRECRIVRGPNAGRTVRVDWTATLLRKARPGQRRKMNEARVYRTKRAEAGSDTEGKERQTWKAIIAKENRTKASNPVIRIHGTSRYRAKKRWKRSALFDLRQFLGLYGTSLTSSAKAEMKPKTGPAQADSNERNATLH